MGCSNAKKPKSALKENKVKSLYPTKNETPLGSFYECSNGKVIAGTILGSIMVFDFDGEKLNLCFIKEKAHEANVVSFTEIQNHILISCSTDECIKLWEFNNNDLTLIHTITDHSNIISKVITLKTFDQFLSCSIDSTLRIYSALQPFKQIKILYEESSLMCAIQLSNMNKHKVVCTGAKYSDGSKPFISIWNIETYEKEHMFQGNEEFMPVFLLELPNGHVAISTKTSVFVVNPNTFEKVSEIKEEKTLNGMPTGICLFESSCILYVCSKRVVRVSLGNYQVKEVSQQMVEGNSTIFTIKKGEFFIVNKGKGILVMNYIEEDEN